ncbi:MAG TPA: hypothetical protein VIM31_00130 [Candidatus Microsaccharimonas sp.]
MEFHDGWALLAAIIYIIGGLVCWFITSVNWEGSRNYRWWKELITGLVLFAIGVAAVSGIAWAVSAGSTADRSATIGEVSKDFGLTSGKEYPLVLGSRISGSSGSGHIVSNFFSVYGSASEQPATAISVSFTHNDASYILEIPTAKITFRKSDGPSKVQLFLNTNKLYDEYAEDPAASTTFSYGACKPVVVNLWLNCVKPQTDAVTVLNESVQRKGLSPIVADNLDSAVITLTPEAYTQLLG